VLLNIPKLPPPDTLFVEDSNFGLPDFVLPSVEGDDDSARKFLAPTAVMTETPLRNEKAAAAILPRTSAEEEEEEEEGEEMMNLLEKFKAGKSLCFDYRFLM